MTNKTSLNKSELSPTIQQASIKNGLILALFALVSTGLIAVVYSITKDRIASEVEAAMARRLNQIIPAEEYDNNVYSDCIKVDELEQLGSNSSKVYRMRNGSKNYALFITSIAPDGYAGKINLVVGLYDNGDIAGVRVTEHQETPGLGDKIETSKSSWISQFDGKSLSNTTALNWQVKKDGGEYDSLTGATITPRAIIKAIYKTLIYYKENKTLLYATPSSCGELK